MMNQPLQMGTCTTKCICKKNHLDNIIRKLIKVSKLRPKNIGQFGLNEQIIKKLTICDNLFMQYYNEASNLGFSTEDINKRFKELFLLERI